ncbi:hypothetical protein MMC16_006149 [Acarospora aff. strigata]|nr:hypothetical protein [Acarospora aff. strigata]
MLRSILHQLLEQDLSLFRYYKEIYRKRRHRGTGHCPWSKDDFQAIFSRIAAAGDDVPQILSVVDGLDESEDSLGGGERGDILSFFSNLVNKHSGSRIKIILLSRPARAFEKEFRHCHQIILEHENSDDIKGVVDSGLRSLRMSIQSFDSSDEESPDTVQRTITKRVGTSRMNQKKGNPPSKNRRLNSCFNQVKDSEQGELNFIRAYLLKHAQGVILWVTLIITELKHHVEKGMYTFIELKELLFHLPLDLDTVYRRIIHDLEQKQDKAEQAKARRILAWVSGASAKQPLQLKEILDALAVPSDLEAALKSVDDPILANRPRFRSWNHFRRSLYEFCGPLVEVIRPTAVARIHLTDESNVDTIDETINDFWDVGPTSVVQLLHQTVKDFLANPKVAHGFSFQPLEAERMVDDDLQKYLKLSLPVIPTPYVPMLEVEASGLEMNVEAVVSYLEGKYLLPFVLNNFPITPQYPLFDYLRAYSPLRRLLSASAIDWRNENTDDPVKNVRNNPLSRYFWLACRQGFVTAVDNMLIMMMILQPRWYSKEAVIQGALLAAIEHRLLHLVRDLLVFCYDVSALLPEAAKTGDEEITMLLYDRWRNKRTDHQGRSWWLARARESSRSSEFDDSMIDDVKEAIERVMLSYRSLRNQ